MLTARGYWFFLVTGIALAVALLVGAVQLTLLCATLLLWFLAQWFLFQLRVRLTLRRLTVARTLRTERGGDIESIWATQKVDVAVVLSSGGWLALPYVVMTDRVPALARLTGGAVCRDGALARGTPMTLEYAIECKAAGWLRFEGVKVQLADLQGLFTCAAFVRDVREYRVLPTLASRAPHASFVKQHNILPLLGTHRFARPGGSSELLDLRDYLPGDPPKMIAWKVSARRDRLITKELESEVPVRCTIFLDTSSSVRVGPVGETALCRLVEIAAGVAQANASERDLTGLCLFDEKRVTDQVRPGRGAKHLMQIIGRLTDVAGLMPHTPQATVRSLLPIAFGLVQDLYPEWLDADVNGVPWWLPWWSPQPSSTIPPGAPRDGSRFSASYRRAYRWRKQLAAILSVRYQLGPGGLALLLENDERCVDCLQRFLAEHQVPNPTSLYDENGDYRFAAPGKPQVLADALLKRIVHGKDNELFVLCVDVLENTDHLAALERAVCVARARHHQVVVICPWPAGVDVPGAKPRELAAPLDFQLILQRLYTTQLHKAYAKVQQAFGRVGVRVLCAAHDDSVNWILHRMRRLRIQERGVR
jgi:uncharacterized protein (DUF58 family)